MGARTTRKPGKCLSGKRDSGAMALTIAAVTIPFFLTFVLIAMDMRPDLSETHTGGLQLDDGSELLGWADLPKTQGERRVRMLGYMMDGYRPVPDDTPVMTFFLLPDAGQLLHPAHRQPAEMVEVWLRNGEPARYSDRAMVWVTGEFRRVGRKNNEEAPRWSLTDAALHPAAERDIRLWFLP